MKDSTVVIVIVLVIVVVSIFAFYFIAQTKSTPPPPTQTTAPQQVQAADLIAQIIGLFKKNKDDEPEEIAPAYNNNEGNYPSYG